MRRGSFTDMPSLAILLAFAAMLTAADEKRLGRALICSERLADDAARLRNIEDFIRRYAIVAPTSRIGQRMETRRKLLARKGCGVAPDASHYTFPED